MRILGTILTAACLLILSGCDDPFFDGEQICNCCGSEVRWPRDRDCGNGACDGHCFPILDAGPGDAGPPRFDCLSPEARALDVICPHAVRAGAETTIPVAFGGSGECFCNQRLHCLVQRAEEPFELELRASMCSDGPICGACFPYLEATCTLPPLEEGLWTVRDQGETAFVLRVVPEDVMPEWGLACISPRAPDALGCGVAWPPIDPVLANRVCHPGGAGVDQRVALTVTDTCGSCGTMPGPCNVEVFDDVLRVRPTRVESQCDIACPDICMPVEHTCVSPPLPAGDWRVFLQDVETGTRLRVPAPGEEPPSFDEVCGEAMGG